jgi:hypothetical protein
MIDDESTDTVGSENRNGSQYLFRRPPHKKHERRNILQRNQHSDAVARFGHRVAVGKNSGLIGLDIGDKIMPPRHFGKPADRHPVKRTAGDYRK